jgi:transposase-like protein
VTNESALVSGEKWHLAYKSMSLLEFQTRFPGEKECRAYLAAMRFPNGPSCPRCGSPSMGLIGSRGLWQCRVKACRDQVSVTAGTVFHRTRTPLQQWFWAVFMVAKDKRWHSALQLSKELNIPYARAWLILHKIRAAMTHRDALYQLEGIVEIDEAYFGGPDSGRRGRGTRRAKVRVALGLRENGKPRFLKMRRVKRLDARTVSAFAQTGIARGSTVRTDGLNVYNELSKEGFRHEATVAPGKGKEDVLHWTHTIISNAKSFIAGTFHGLDEKHIESYLHEYCYRFNRRHREAELFDRLLFACLGTPPTTRDELTA